MEISEPSYTAGGDENDTAAEENKKSGSSSDCSAVTV